jgi:hypothetical protein
MSHERRKNKASRVWIKLAFVGDRDNMTNDVRDWGQAMIGGIFSTP